MVTPGREHRRHASWRSSTAAIGDNAGLIPAGLGDVGYNDRPIDYALVDARAAAIAAMTADTAANRACRNTVVILITGGKDDGNAAYNAAHNPATTAATFLTVTGGGVTRRVPIHVIGVKPAAADEAEMQAIATASGGRYHEGDQRRGGRGGDQLRRAAGLRALGRLRYRHGERVSAGQPDRRHGQPEEREGLERQRAAEHRHRRRILAARRCRSAQRADHRRVLAARLRRPHARLPVLQAGRRLDQADRLEVRQRRHHAVARSRRPARRWRAWRACPADPNSRNIYTYIPNGAGGGSVVAFTTANAATLAAHMGAGPNTSDAHLRSIRAQPLGAIIGSTPALDGSAVARSAARRRLRPQRMRRGRSPATTRTAAR